MIRRPPRSTLFPYTTLFRSGRRSHIPTRETANRWPHLKSISEEIPDLLSCDIGLLIGFNCSRATTPRAFVSGTDDEPYAVKTPVGWYVVGNVSSASTDHSDELGISHNIRCQVIPENLKVKSTLPGFRFHDRVTINLKTSVHEMKFDASEVMKLLEGDFLHDSPTDDVASQEDKQFLNKLTQEIYQDADGHYVMPLPFKEDKPVLPNNRAIALSRFKALRRQLDKDKTKEKLYNNFMADLLSSGQAELVPHSELEKEEVWYLPHHGVLSDNKPGKIRVVFDGSCMFQGHSLNQYLLQGPDLNNTLVGVLTRFRLGPVAISCDIAKMYHQFRVSGPYRDYLRFFWTDPNDSKTKEYRMTVHIFGATSSPNCAKFGLQQLAKDYGHISPQAQSFIQREFYVDDGLTSCNSSDEAIKLLDDTKTICSKGKLKLHKLLSNHQDVLQEFPEVDWAVSGIHIGQDKHIERALGLKWDIEGDIFIFNFNTKETPLTRRGILSKLASIFDPLGFIAPIILVGRQIMQLMASDIGWDDDLPPSIAKKWTKWTSQLEDLENVSINRCVRPAGFSEQVRSELHIFGDASKIGYGACCYIRLIDENGNISSSLLYEKSRVPPKKSSLTIARLELQAVVVATKIGRKMAGELEINADNCHYYTDSEICLGYIKNTTAKFHMFVANRVYQIRERTDIKLWHHIDGKINPADHASRGQDPKQLMTSNWLTGPSFLQENKPIPETPTPQIPDDDPEIKTESLCLNTETVQDMFPMLDLIKRYSTWKAVLRFITPVYLTCVTRWKQPHSVETERMAEIWLIKMHQKAMFTEDYDMLSTEGGKVLKSSPLWTLNPFIDEEGLLRVGGRLKFTSLTDYEMHPVIVPGKTHLSTLLIRHYHSLIGHQGRGFTMATIRRAGYWITNLSRITASIIYSCVPCRMMRRPPETQKMCDLPKDRTEEAPPFTYVGCDLFGPFQVVHGRKTEKKYGVIFTCMSSRAVHLELLDDMTTDSFINCLRCFFALRGDVRQIRCDRGTNFVGADNELNRALEEIDNSLLKSFLLQHRCEFVFNTPGSSHMGGAWERLIHTVRSVLTGIMIESHGRLDTYSARTVMYEAMAIVNSRPIAPFSDQDSSPLTPNKILHMKSGVVMPPPGKFDTADVYSRKRWRRVQGLVENFWTRWRTHYLNNLQRRSKWQEERRSLKVGDVVMLKEGTFRSDFCMAKVIRVLPSKDGLVRRVEIKTSHSVIERPISKLVLLVEAE